MKDYYIFPAIFGYDVPEQVGVAFPDLPGCTSQGNNDSDAFTQARVSLGLHLFSMERDGDIIPEPSLLHDIELEDYETLALIDIFMPPVRDELKSKHIAA